MISVLIPSRGRPEWALESVRSLYDNAKSCSTFEVLLRLDNDDSCLGEYLSTEWPLGLSVVIVTGERGRGYPDMHVYVNELCERAKGDWLLLFNDDARMCSIDWDDVILSGNFPKRCVLRLSQSDQLNLFPVVSRAFYETLGHFSLNAHNDTWVETIADTLGVQFSIPVEVVHLRGQLEDETYKHTSSSYATTSPDFYSAEVQKLLMEDIEKMRVAL